MPCYNPGDRWQEELFAFYTATSHLYTLHFIIVNDGSRNTANIQEQITLIKNRGISVLLISYEKNMGKGYALRQGVAAAGSPLVLYTDIDFPFTDESTLRVLLNLADESCDIAVGYRADNYYQKTMSFYRKVLSKSFRFFIRRILGMEVTDTQCGLKGFNQKGKEKFLATTINRYLFDFEFIYTSGRDHSLKLKTVEVKLKENVMFSKMRPKILLQEMFNLSKVLLFRKRS